MSKSNITKKTAVNAFGILGETESGQLYLEMTDTGKSVLLNDIMQDFNGEMVKITINHDIEFNVE